MQVWPIAQRVTTMHQPRSVRLHYAWVILAVTGLTVVMTAGVTAVPAVRPVMRQSSAHLTRLLHPAWR